jgi:hypothetical protein
MPIEHFIGGAPQYGFGQRSRAGTEIEDSHGKAVLS